MHCALYRHKSRSPIDGDAEGDSLIIAPNGSNHVITDVKYRLRLKIRGDQDQAILYT